MNIRINMTHRHVMHLLLALGTLLFSLHSMAVCTVSGAYTGYATLRGQTYSAGADFASGGTMYRQVVNGVRSVNYSCNNGNAKFTLSLVGGVPMAGTTDTYASGIVGVGVKITGLNGSALPVTVPYSNASGTLSTTELGFSVTAVKTGPVTAGTANGALLPPVLWTVTDNSGIPVTVATTNWNPGGFAINTPSCTTPDYTFDLGAVNISDSAPNSSWVSTPVILTGCGTFYGNLTDSSGYNTSQATATAGTFLGFDIVGTRAKNIVTMTLSPQITAIDPANGILANTPGGGVYARGVGVQMGKQSGSTYTPLNLANPQVVTPDLSSSSNISFPLGARIVKTDSVVNPGKVVTAVTYTITYQ